MGFHKYQNKWDPIIGEVLETQIEPTNKTEKYAVVVLKNENVVGHSPKENIRKIRKNDTLLFKVSKGHAEKSKLKG